MVSMSEFKIGTVVVYRTDDQIFGHVVGFTRVWEGSSEGYRTKIVVQWSLDYDYDTPAEIGYRISAEYPEDLILV